MKNNNKCNKNSPGGTLRWENWKVCELYLNKAVKNEKQ